ncbi:3-oxoacyl-ACP reductase FabG [Polycladomyces sp. WAk]|uniref:3-oxoacyl-ACP reductase FabG n=1 Tax=Polycladomyces zharkentensis TaxID=2807616 RepID=A0ABS2WIL6_9BACL|nr:3-oxoacyl-ACP reductase FabG [Polycladomyces sp. WAk]MBN2909400.1 3-oxoacyl-ACP reductase FabG [Polycladomyces sp. WAk]
MHETPLKDRVAIVTGASRGIGAAIAERLAQEGAFVAVGYRVEETKAEEVVERCRRHGVYAYAYRADVRSRSDVEEMVRRVKRELGPPLILVHNAGVAGIGLIQDVTDDQYATVFDTHIKGAIHLIQACLPDMLSRHFGRIVLLSSIWGESGGAGEALYSAAKGAVNGMARALAKELGPSGITVNAVAPGAIETDMLRAQLAEEERSALVGEIPVGRLGQPADVAALTAFLCREEAGYLTGQVLHVNGGWYP